MSVSTRLLEREITTDEQRLLDLVAAAQKREGELEAMYVEGTATDGQLAELEQLRAKMEAALEALDNLGYFNYS